MGLFDRLKASLKKTRDAIASGFSRVFRGALSEDKLEEIEEALLEADVGVATTDVMLEGLRGAWKKGEVKDAEQALPFLKKFLKARLAEGAGTIALVPEGPTVVLVVGVNGSGKTTSIAKLAGHFRGLGKSVVLGAGDTFRAAAVEQLTIWSKRIGVEIVKQATGADPAAVAFDAADAAVAREADVCIVDTAGRLHTQQNLMKELEKIRRVLGKRIPGAPRPELASGVPVPEAEWQHITCDICHVPVGDSYATSIAFWNQALGEYELVADVMELCARCHEGQHGFEVVEEQEVSPAHTGWECTRCHGAHGTPVACTDCHDAQTGPGAFEHERHPSVNCTACHDNGRLTIWQDPVSGGPHEAEYITRRFAHTLTSWPSHNLTVEVDCLRCHHPLGPQAASVVPAVSCEACHQHQEGASLFWCEYFERNPDPNAR